MRSIKNELIKIEYKDALTNCMGSISPRGAHANRGTPPDHLEEFCFSQRLGFKLRSTKAQI